MASDGRRSRSPRRGACKANLQVGASVEEDVNAAHRLRKAYAPPRQSKFRVASLLRFTRTDGSVGTIEAVNAEPHDANIRGAICAERAAFCQFQRDEADRGSRVVRVIVATDADAPIFPGPLCREFLTATCEPDVEVVASGAGGKSMVRPLGELLPLPMLYRLSGDQDAMRALGARLGPTAAPPAGDELLAATYRAAVARAKKQESQAVVFPVLFAAAVGFTDGRVHSVAEVKGIEYGCTVDAVSLLLPELFRVREEGGAPAAVVAQADQFGLAHAPFAAARSLLMEHGFGDLRIFAHDKEGSLAAPITVKESLPLSNFTELFE